MLDAIYIILIMVVFFGGIIGYCYGSVWYQDNKENRKYEQLKRAREEREETIKRTYEARRLEREEKYRASRERSAYIKEELKRLQLTKQGVVLEEE